MAAGHRLEGEDGREEGYPVDPRGCLKALWTLPLMRMLLPPPTLIYMQRIYIHKLTLTPNGSDSLSSSGRDVLLWATGLVGRVVCAQELLGADAAALGAENSFLRAGALRREALAGMLT